MTKQVVRTEQAPAPFQGAPYSQAIKAAGLVFVSGQLALVPGAKELTGDSIESQGGHLMRVAVWGGARGAGADGRSHPVRTLVFGDGLGFIVLGLTPEAMGKGNWSVGVVVDERATADQRDAITAIGSGSAGGPMAGVGPLVGKFLGVASAPIVFERNGANWSVTASSLVDMAANGAMGIDPSATEPLHLDNTGHPASSRFALAHALKSHVDALGLSWNDTTGTNNGQYAPFNWKSA